MGTSKFTSDDLAPLEARLKDENRMRDADIADWFSRTSGKPISRIFVSRLRRLLGIERMQGGPKPDPESRRSYRLHRRRLADRRSRMIPVALVKILEEEVEPDPTPEYMAEVEARIAEIRAEKIKAACENNPHELFCRPSRVRVERSVVMRRAEHGSWSHVD